MKVAAILSLILLTMAAPVFSQPDSLWWRAYGGGGNDYAWSLVETVDGGYVLGGITTSSGAGNRDAWMVKTDENGDTLWCHTFGGPLDDWAGNIGCTLDGGYFVAGWTNSFGGNDNCWLISLDANGDTLWSRRYGGAGNDYAYWGVQTSDRGYVLVGGTNSYGAGGTDLWLVKTNAWGDTMWTRTFGGSGTDYGTYIQAVSDGYILCGQTTSGLHAPGDFWLLKMDLGGNLVWQRFYGTTSEEKSVCVRQTADGNYVVTGYKTNQFDGTTDVWLVKAAANGSMLWNRTFGQASRWEAAPTVLQTSDSGLVLAASTQHNNYVLAGDFLIIRTDADGNLLWSRTYGGAADEEGFDIVQKDDGSYLIAGYSSITAAAPRDAILMKTGPDPSFVAAPQNLIIVPMGTNVDLRWNAVSGSGVQYNVYCDSTADGAFTQLLTTTADTSFVDTATADIKFYAVRAERP